MARLRVDHCTRCEEPFAFGVPAFVVSERLICEVLPNGVGIWKAERAPVCERCLTPKDGPFPHEATCAGCGRGLRYRGRRPVSACSSHCAQRARRRFRKRLPLARHCTVCGESFQPTRTDARYCSSPCRQAAYRRRRAG